MSPDFDLSRWLVDLRVCLALYTRIPMPGDERPDLARASWAAPVAGALVGLAGAAVLWLAGGLGLPPWAAALLAVGTTILITGALHEDGLADVADGFGGAFARADKLAIMRDARIGTYGTLALILSVGLRAAALAAIAEPLAAGAALIAAHAGARALLPAVMRRLPLARAEGLAADAGTPQPRTVAVGLGLAALLAVVTLGPGTAVLAAVAAIAAATAMVAIARRQIGGYTGDVLGASEQLAEIAILVTAASV
jgi:adenosylcobinamide-GDP ribazoletransferase